MGVFAIRALRAISGLYWALEWQETLKSVLRPLILGTPLRLLATLKQGCLFSCFMMTMGYDAVLLESRNVNAGSPWQCIWT